MLKIINPYYSTFFRHTGYNMSKLISCEVMQFSANKKNIGKHLRSDANMTYDKFQNLLVFYRSCSYRFLKLLRWWLFLCTFLYPLDSKGWHICTDLCLKNCHSVHRTEKLSHGEENIQIFKAECVYSGSYSFAIFTFLNASRVLIRNPGRIDLCCKKLFRN